MDPNEKNVNTEPILDDGGTGTAADVEAVMKKYDRVTEAAKSRSSSAALP